jgi:hypothetical protein
MVGGGAIASVILAGCTTGDGVDTSAAGQIAYACGLSEQITTPDSWDTPVGDDADPGAIAAQATISLLGGSGLYKLPDHPELTEAARELARAFQSFDQDAFQEALYEISEGCDDIKLPEEPTFDGEGQVTYACALSRSIDAERVNHDSGSPQLKNHAWHEAYSVAALVGAANGGSLPEAKELAEAARKIVRATDLADRAAIPPALEDFIDSCPT